MRLSEIIVLYMTAAAPFGASHFIRRNSPGRSSSRLIFESLLAAMLWPVLIVKEGVVRARGRRATAAGTITLDTIITERIERSARETLNSLLALEDAMQLSDVALDEPTRQKLFEARQGVERYAGLALASAASNEQTPPREIELFRLAGRTGDDLNLAVRCIHRRNNTRLSVHRERARCELLRSLTAILARTKARENVAALPRDARRVLHSKLLRALAHARRLSKLLGDEKTASEIIALLEAARRGLSGQNSERVRQALVASKRGEPCMAQASLHTLDKRTRGATNLRRELTG